MTIEAGALSLRISETGADAVLAKLNAIDQKAATLGQTVGKNLTFNSPSLTSANGNVQALTMNLTKLGQVQQQLIQQGPQMAGPIRLLSTPLPSPVSPATVPAIQNLGGMLQNLALKYATVQFAAQTAMRAASAVVGFLGDQIEAGDAMHDFATRTGVSVESLFVLGHVADNAGADLQSVVTGFRALNIQTAKALSGNKEAIETFDDIGISVDDLRGKNPEQVFLMVANALSKYKDAAFVAEEAQKLLGRGGNVLISMMKELAGDGFAKAKEEVDKLGGAMTTQFADRADEFKDKSKNMHVALEALGRAIDLTLLPPMTRFVELLTTLLARYDAISKSPLQSSALAGFLSQIPGGALLSLLIPGKESAASAPGKASVNGAELMGAAVGQQALEAEQREREAKKKRRQAAEEAAKEAEAERKRLAKEHEKEVAKAMAADLGDIGLRTRGEGAMSDVPTGPTPTVGVDKNGKMKGVKAFGIGDVIDKEFAALAAKLKEKQEFINGIIRDVAGSVGNAFGDAFTAAFEGGNFFAALGKSLLASIGGMVMQLGEAMLTYGTLMAIGAPLLMASPFAGQALSAPAAIAGGIGLIALGAGMGAIGKGGSKGGGGGGGSSGGRNGDHERNQWDVAFDPDHKLRKRAGPAVIPSVRGIDNTPMPTGPGVVNIGVINTLHPDDAKWQRVVTKTVSNAKARGIG